MQRKLAILITAAVCAAFAPGVITTASAEEKGKEKEKEKAASATGTWTWTARGRGGDGGAERKSTLTLKQDGEKLTGKLSQPGRGGEARETEIADGSVKGDDISFTVTREGQDGNKRVTKYTGKLSADAITGSIEAKDRDGNDQKRDWKATKEAAK